MIPVFERVETFYALDRAATVIGNFLSYLTIIYFVSSREGFYGT
jgi:hypothetical protein